MIGLSPRLTTLYLLTELNLMLPVIKLLDLIKKNLICYWIFICNHEKRNFQYLLLAGAITAVSGITPMITALSANPSKSTTPIYLLPRSNNGENRLVRDWKVPVEAPSRLWLLHVANAYENVKANGNLNLQIHACACSYQWFNFHKLFGISLLA